MGELASAWWRADGWPTPEEWSAVWTALTLVVAVLAAVVALRQLRAHFEAERLRSRPYVIVDFVFSSILMKVEIRNISGAAATDIDLRVDPPFQSSRTDDAADLNAVFSAEERISMLAPGRRILYTLERAPDYLELGFPQRYTVTLSYGESPKRYHRSAATGWRRREVRYTEKNVLDFRQWSRAAAESDYENKNWNIASRQEQRTEKIVKVLGKIADHLEHGASLAQEAQVVRHECDVAPTGELTSGFELLTPVESDNPSEQATEGEASAAPTLDQSTDPASSEPVDAHGRYRVGETARLASDDSGEFD